MRCESSKRVSTSYPERGSPGRAVKCFQSPFGDIGEHPTCISGERFYRRSRSNPWSAFCRTFRSGTSWADTLSRKISLKNSGASLERSLESSSTCHLNGGTIKRALRTMALHRSTCYLSIVTISFVHKRRPKNFSKANLC